ncbi:MAG TPA: STAS domain-containing protein [Ideonella sp.]|uniref:STAS domain-containing protein n=1 Tax=Ideonella sp. TaxID=1929293 RepID=UPI002E2FB0E5|nr:STAS domain-containing protein [Ideonella sp.]HEX5682429.1 STAS domain-containing protein [Ideonella sp.]
MTEAATLILPAALTLRDARSALATLGPAIAAAGDGTIVIDAGALVQIDSASLAVLLQCRRLAEGRQRGFEVRNAPAKLVDLAKLYGVAELLGMA